MSREAQWRKRCKTVCGIARDLQFKEVADSIRLSAIVSVLKPAELTEINARIKTSTAALRARFALREKIASADAPLTRAAQEETK